MLQEGFGENAMSQSETFLWYKPFKDGRNSVDDDERSGRTSTSTSPENTAKRQPGGTLRFCLLRTQTRNKRRPQIHLLYHNRWWNMGVRLWPWDEQAVIAVEIAKFTAAKKRRVKFAATSSRCWSFFDIHGPAQSNSYPLAGPSMASFTVRIWSGWGTAFGLTSRQVEGQQLVSPPWQHARSHITHCSTNHDFQTHSPPPPPYSPYLAP
jgi:hypothetical protein